MLMQCPSLAPLISIDDTEECEAVLEELEDHRFGGMLRARNGTDAGPRQRWCTQEKFHRSVTPVGARARVED